MRRAPLWICPECERRFANRNQPHSCGRHTLREHFAGKPQKVVALFRAFVRLIRRCGPVLVVPEKTRIAFQARMSFAAVSLRKEGIVGHVVLARRLDCPRLEKVESISPRNHVHSFSFKSMEELDDEVLCWLREAYSVGMQHHLDSNPRLAAQQEEWREAGLSAAATRQSKRRLPGSRG